MPGRSPSAQARRSDSLGKRWRLGYEIVEFMALAMAVHNGAAGVIAHPAGAAGEANYAQGCFTSGMGRGFEHGLGRRVGFHGFQSVDSAIHQPIVGFAIVVDVVDAALIVLKPNLVMRVWSHFGHRLPGHGP